MQHVPQQACHQAPTPFVPQLWLLEGPESLAKIHTRLQAGNMCPPALRRQERIRDLCLSLVGSSRWPSLALLPLLGLRDIYPADKADRPQDSSWKTSLNASFLRSSAVLADFQTQQLRS